MSKTAQVYTDDPGSSVVNLTVTGRVENFISLSPPAVRLQGPVGRPLEEEVRIIPNSDSPLRITAHRAVNGSHIRYQISPDRFDGRDGYRLLITTTSRTAGDFLDFIELETDSPLKPKLRVRVQGTILESRDNQPDNRPTGDVFNQKEPL